MIYQVLEVPEVQDGTLDLLSEGRGYVRRSLARFGRKLVSPILELGSGTGNITGALLDRGHTVIATDISEPRLDRLRQRHRAEIELGRLWTRVLDLTAPESMHLDGDAPRTVVAFNVLEHVVNDVDCARAVHGLLARGGAFAVLVPAHQALYSDFDAQLGHHRRYSAAGLEGVLRSAGFRVDFCSYFNLVGALGWWVNCRLLKRTALPAGPFKIFDRLTPVLTFEDSLPVPFGLSVVALAVKDP